MSDDPVIRFGGGAKASSSETPRAKFKPKGLGRGLGALLGDSKREEPLAVTVGDSGNREQSGPSGGLATLPVADITPHPDQPRRQFDEAGLDELASSIAQRGVIQPVIVTPSGGGKYRLVAGERRWRAAQRAQLHQIPAIVRQLSERDVMALALIENLQREDLNPIEEARAYQRLAEHDGLTQAEIARTVDKSRSHVANLQRLLSLPDEVISLVESGDLSMGHARALVGCEEAKQIAQAAVAKELSVREVEKLVRRLQKGDSSGPRMARSNQASAENADITAVQDYLEEFLGLPVRINADADPRSGAVTIRYGTLDQLDLICQRLTGGSI